MSTEDRTATAHTRIVALISGSGSNLQAIIDACREQRIAGEIVAVISNKNGVFGLERAVSAGIPALVMDHRDFSDRADFDQALQRQIDACEPALVVLAGFMRILTPAFVQHYQGRLLNIHPSLLPAYKGTHTHQRVLDDQGRIHGASVHFVTPELDGGPVILQARVPVLAQDSTTTLAARVLVQEHVIYPRVVEWFCAGRLRLDGEQILLDEQPLMQPVILDDSPDPGSS
ncbi:MAG TPA: phosphoribosylglycinamide formyltransferase [Thiolinea sp.]|nr:phosphoribosylglycinamide formyltransferase [Thiolinea sp.]